jgi:hypothetical protein
MDSARSANALHQRFAAVDESRTVGIVSSLAA